MPEEDDAVANAYDLAAHIDTILGGHSLFECEAALLWCLAAVVELSNDPDEMAADMMNKLTSARQGVRELNAQINEEMGRARRKH